MKCTMWLYACVLWSSHRLTWAPCFHSGLCNAQHRGAVVVEPYLSHNIETLPGRENGDGGPAVFCCPSYFQSHGEPFPESSHDTVGNRAFKHHHTRRQQSLDSRIIWNASKPRHRRTLLITMWWAVNLTTPKDHQHQNVFVVSIQAITVEPFQHYQ